jgi:hypothetical protein
MSAGNYVVADRPANHGAGFSKTRHAILLPRCETKFFADFAFQFEMPGKIWSPSLKFSRKSAPKKQ